MNYVDRFLLNLLGSTTVNLSELISDKDFRILVSLGSSADSSYFITENQSRLLMKILRENQKRLNVLGDEYLEILENPTWSRPFRKIEEVRKFYIGQDDDGEQQLVVEFNFSSNLRKILLDASKHVENLTTGKTGKKYVADMTEKNIVYLYEKLEPFKFEVDETLKNHYQTIKSWSHEDFKNQFLLDTITNTNFINHVSRDFSPELEDNELLSADRRQRYQYFGKNTEKSENFLTNKIANRTGQKLWVDANVHTLTDVMKSLVELKRLPVLVVFDGYQEVKIFENLKKLSTSLDELNLSNNVGIYFRLPNSETGKMFNDLIKDKSYNKKLDASTEIVGAINGKIPKFFLSSGWKPMSVLSVDTGLRNSKTSVFASSSDLIITYTDSKPLTEKWL